MNLPSTQLSVFADLQGLQRYRRGHRLDEDAVRELAEFSGEPGMTSLYIDIDGRRRPALSECDTALEGLFRAARHQAEAVGAPAALAADEDLALIQEWIAAGVDRAQTRGLALFSCAGKGFLRVFTLPVAVADHVAVGDRPDVGPLEEIIDRTRPVFVALVDSQQARLMRYLLGTLAEVETIVDPLERQVDTDVELGSWEHRHEEAVRRHLRRVAAAVTRHLDRLESGVLVVGGPVPAADDVVGFLPGHVADRIAGRVSVAMHGQDEEFRRELADISDVLEAEREAGVIQRLQGRVAAGEASAGLEGALAAINEGRADTLVVARGYEAPGARCRSCGHLAPTAVDCPWCAEPSEALDNVVDDAIDRALAQDARVEFTPAGSLDEMGNIAVIERHR